jgi:nicotinate-nucleotide adenylyltransferase
MHLTQEAPRVGILGGTFNPVHNGHLRHAVEVGEALGLERVLLTPCASPPHKTKDGLLPFELRVAFLREAVRGIPLLEVSTLEGELDGPSYTWASLSERHRRSGACADPDSCPLPAPAERPFFMMGAESFSALHTWRRGMELPKLGHLVMVPRGGEDRSVFRASIRRYWPESLPDDERADEAVYERETIALAGEAAGGGHCTFLPVPRLDISSTFIRRRWCEGRSLAGLVPEGVLALMERERAVLEELWR